MFRYEIQKASIPSLSFFTYQEDIARIIIKKRALTNANPDIYPIEQFRDSTIEASLSGLKRGQDTDR